jgi:hypothetical protein
VSRYDWAAIIPAARAIVGSYDTPVTLRQLFYRLVSVELLPNKLAAYKSLSSTTAELRRQGTFPDLSDRTRSIHVAYHYADPQEALEELAADYRRDRTEGQPWIVCLGVEKNGLVEQLRAWFDDRGLPVLALGGYASQSYVKQVRQYIGQERPAVLLYAGDFDASGVDIQRDFVERTGCFGQVERVALTWEQVEDYELPPLPGKATDSRAAAFARKHGDVQVELDALPPEVLRQLFEEAAAPFADVSAYGAVLREEENERRELEALCS